MNVLEIHVNEEQFPPFDPGHGTPDAMIRRRITIHTPRGSARFEQSDYGHPNRFNPWDPRGIDSPLQPTTDALKALCEAITPFL